MTIRRAACGFTLIELLVVVAIISLLIAILVPSLSEAREQSKRVVCQSHLKEIAKGWRMYWDAHQGRLLQYVNVNINYGGKQGKGDRMYGADPKTPVPKPLNSYLNLPSVVRDGAEVFGCPSDRGGKVERPTMFNYYGTSYTTNLLLIAQDQFPIHPLDPCAMVWRAVNTRLKNLNVSKISVPESELVLVGDYGWVDAWHFASKMRIEWHGKPYSHNVAFMDGHAAFVRIRKGIHVSSRPDPRYTIIPFNDLLNKMVDCQKEIQ